MGVQLDRNPCSRSPESVFIMAGIGVHDAWNRCSASVGIGVHVRPESAFMMGRNLHSLATSDLAFALFVVDPRALAVSSKNLKLRPRHRAVFDAIRAGC